MFIDVESPELVTMDEKQLLFPPKRFQYSEVSCSCDGLVLLKNPTVYKYYLLWNRSTRENRLLECPYVKSKDVPPSPNACGEEDFFCLTKVKGCLGLYGGKRASKELHVWIMEQDEDGWKWLLKICDLLPTACGLFVLERQLLHYTKNGEVLFQGNIDHGITRPGLDPAQLRPTSICLIYLMHSQAIASCI
ncbi:hypothetical protein FXO37_10920, partial [Capsicum annuum]